MDDDAVSTTIVTAAAAEAPVPPRPRTRTRDAVAGVVAVLAALGASELVAASCRRAVAGRVDRRGCVIDHQPPGAKDFVVGALRDERQARPRGPDPRRRGADRRRPRDRRPPVVRRGRGRRFAAFAASASSPRSATRSRPVDDRGGRAPVVGRLRRHSSRPRGCSAVARRRPHRRRARRPGRCPTGRAGRSSSGRARSRAPRSSRACSAGGCSSGQRGPRRPGRRHAVPPASDDGRALPPAPSVARRPRHHPDRHAERPLLPDRHRADHARASTSRPGSLPSTGIVDREVTLTYAQLNGAADSSSST